MGLAVNRWGAFIALTLLAACTRYTIDNALEDGGGTGGKSAAGGQPGTAGAPNAQAGTSAGGAAGAPPSPPELGLPAHRFDRPEDLEGFLLTTHDGGLIADGMRWVKMQEGERSFGAIEVTGSGVIRCPQVAGVNGSEFVLKSRVRAEPRARVKIYSYDDNGRWMDSGEAPVETEWMDRTLDAELPGYIQDDFNIGALSVFGPWADAPEATWYVDAIWAEPRAIVSEGPNPLERWTLDEGVKASGDGEGKAESSRAFAFQGSGLARYSWSAPADLADLVVTVTASRGAKGAARLAIVAADTAGAEVRTLPAPLTEEWSDVRLSVPAPEISYGDEFKANQVAYLALSIEGDLVVDRVEFSLYQP
jgi:hypothetical protein